MSISTKQFEKLINEAVGKIPEPFRGRLENIAFLLEDEPTSEQRQRLNLFPGETLLGLYEGVPLPGRGGATKTLPDKITLFKNPLLAASRDMEELKENIRHTVWHEVAHYYGLDHTRIHELENKGKRAARASDSFRARRDKKKP